ncbi:type II secretion system protein [Bacillus sp. FJAT-49705]|uniref:Type II secretion system protein n=1 Tax=Cytobacillus citreus TaxID=2833586 RepID=A0ABS5NX27_9BACI|nr:type II secretion system GspH family protein [Cytobacillus citreus]MBS4191479.1 type II secretion system protein [Cytobacillus citreus]
MEEIKKLLVNKRGYALLTVLLTITIFMIISLSFMGQSANSMKQNKEVEKKSQSVALSEMGILYFESAIKNAYYSNYNIVLQEIKNERENHIKNKELKDNQYYIQKARDKMKEIIKIKIITELENKPPVPFEIDYQVDPDGSKSNEISIVFISTGNESGKKTKIKASMTIDFTDFLTMEDKDSGNPGESESLLSGNEILDPGNLTACRNEQTDFTNSRCQINGSASYHNNQKLVFDNSVFRVNGTLSFQNLNNKDMNDSIIYVLGSMTTENLNSLKQSKIHVNGAANFGHFNGSGLTDSIIEVAGSATFDNMKMDNSKIFVGSPARFNQINNMNNSIIFINSSASIQGINLESNSTVCVNGNLSINNINDNSKGSSKIYAESSSHSKVITNPTSFENACKRNSTIKWGDPTISIKYDYNYN